MYKKVAHHVIEHIVPTPDNSFVPHILKGPAVWAMLGVSVALLGFSQFLRTTDYLNINAEVYPTVLVQMTNEDRIASGMQPLAVNPVLERAAYLKVQDMVAKNYFAHTSPEGVSPWYWFKQAGYTFRFAGENLAVNFSESSDVQQAWLNSPAHRANVLNPNFTEMGIATAYGTYKGVNTAYVVELFGTPATSSRTAVVPTTPIRPSSQVQQESSVTDSRVAGESIDTLRTIDESPSFVSVENTDPTLVVQPASTTTEPRVSWFSRFMLNIDKHIGTVLEVFVGALIIAMAGLATREHQKHHRRHFAYGLLMVIVLSSMLFVGRIGVFAETPSAQIQLPYLEF